MVKETALNIRIDEDLKKEIQKYLPNLSSVIRQCLKKEVARTRLKAHCCFYCGDVTELDELYVIRGLLNKKERQEFVFLCPICFDKIAQADVKEIANKEKREEYEETMLWLNLFMCRDVENYGWAVSRSEFLGGNSLKDLTEEILTTMDYEKLKRHRDTRINRVARSLVKLSKLYPDKFKDGTAGIEADDFSQEELSEYLNQVESDEDLDKEL